MNRILTTIGVVALLVAGCGGDGDNGGNGGSGSTGGGMDLSASAGNDMSSTLPGDMQPAYGCHALEACVTACAGNQTCIGTCAQSSTMQAITLANAMTRCRRRQCNPVPDGGPAPCTNGGGTPSPECLTCQQDVFKATGTCGADTTYCGGCYMQYTACQADLP